MNKELEQHVQLYFDYLVKEGVVIKMENGNYRLKTKEEKTKEMNAILSN